MKIQVYFQEKLCFEKVKWLTLSGVLVGALVSYLHHHAVNLSHTTQNPGQHHLFSHIRLRMIQTTNKTNTNQFPSSSRSSKTDRLLGDKIVGGTIVVNKTKFSSFGFSNFICGGTLIHPEFFLTAAHCKDAVFTTNSTIYFGGLKRSGVDSTVSVLVKELFPHPRFTNNNSLGNPYDIMLLKLSTPINNVPLQELNYNPLKPVLGQSLFTLGYGQTVENGPVSNVLREVTISTLNSTSCATYWGARVEFNRTEQLCAGVLLGGKDTCGGDSGGPVYMETINQTFVQVGITSFGDGCARPDSYPVYTRISAYEAFIKDTIKNNLSITESKCSCKWYQFFCRILRRCVR